LADQVVFPMDQTAPSHQALLRYFRKCRENPNPDRVRRLGVGGDHDERTQFEGFAAYLATDPLRYLVRKNLTATNACRVGGRHNEHHLA
jgi:hypothetical protein